MYFIYAYETIYIYTLIYTDKKKKTKKILKKLVYFLFSSYYINKGKYHLRYLARFLFYKSFLLTI